MIDVVGKHYETIKRILSHVEYRSGGVLQSELAAFVALCYEHKVDAVIESGRRNGFSTSVLADAMCSWQWNATTQAVEESIPVYSVELDPIPEVDRAIASPNLHLHVGDGLISVPTLAAKFNRPAILLDGPKGLKALSLWERIAPNSVFCGIHDASKFCQGDGKRDINQCREPFEKAGAWFSDDPEYVYTYSHLDTKAWEGEYESRESFTAVGFTLAIFKGGKWKR